MGLPGVAGASGLLLPLPLYGRRRAAGLGGLPCMHTACTDACF